MSKPVKISLAGVHRQEMESLVSKTGLSITLIANFVWSHGGASKQELLKTHTKPKKGE